MGDVVAAPAEHVVHHTNRKAPLDEDIDHVAADESGATGDYRNRFLAHLAPIAFMVRTL
jgi:hypothetical protein